MVQDPNAKCTSYLRPRRAITLVEWRGAAGSITVGDGVPSRTKMRPHRRGKPCHRPNQPIEHRPQWCSKALYRPPPPGDVVHYPDNLGSKPPHYTCITPILPSCLRPIQPPSLVVIIPESRRPHGYKERVYLASRLYISSADSGRLDDVAVLVHACAAWPEEWASRSDDKQRRAYNDSRAFKIIACSTITDVFCQAPIDAT